MKNRSRLLIPLLTVALALPVGSAIAQDADMDGPPGSLGDMISEGIETVADSLGDLAAGIDPSDPDAEGFGDIDPSDPGAGVDPDSPADGDDVDPGDIDPSDPGANPGDPIEPSDPDGTTPDDGDGDGGIELPEPAEPEEGGFQEIQLLPDPAPRAGRWTVVNHPGRMTCTGAGSIALKRSQQRTRIRVLEDGRVLRGPRLAPGAGSIRMTWQPESEAYTGVVRVAAPGGRTRIRFYLRVVSQNRMKGEMVATVNVDSGGIRGSCTGSREITLRRN